MSEEYGPPDARANTLRRMKRVDPESNIGPADATMKARIRRAAARKVNPNANIGPEDATPAARAARAIKARKIQDGPSSSYNIQPVPSVKAHMNRAAIKGSFGAKRLVSDVSVDKMGNASFFSMNTETKQIKKITFERGGSMTVEDQPRGPDGRWI